MKTLLTVTLIILLVIVITQQVNFLLIVDNITEDWGYTYHSVQVCSDYGCIWVDFGTGFKG